MGPVCGSPVPRAPSQRGTWKITPQAIDEWARAHCAPTREMPTSAHTEQLIAYPAPNLDAGAELQVEREARRQAEVEAGELRGKLAATEAERDRLHSLDERLTAPQTKRCK